MTLLCEVHSQEIGAVRRSCSLLNFLKTMFYSKRLQKLVEETSWKTVSCTVPSGQLPLIPLPIEELHAAGASSLSSGCSSGSASQWKTQVSGQVTSSSRNAHHWHASSSPKREFQQDVERERERNLGHDEYVHDQKRSKVQDSVHTLSSQMQSQLVSARGVSVPMVLTAAQAAVKYNDAQLPLENNRHLVPAPSSNPSVNPLDEPSPLGLTLRKTPSLLDLISMKLAQTAGKDQGFAHSEVLAAEAVKNRAGKCLVPNSSNQDKLKASNFPASSLKIGRWERTSRYEGDLVGKCYYAKRKLVWEVLEAGLKSKIEIQWSDISAMKASCPENLPGSLEIEVSRPPLFFRETNPQPRKHTLWQATSDFTGGHATMHKRHSLVFPEGVLNRHYEKLVQCDPRLKALVEGTLQWRPSAEFDRENTPGESQHKASSASQQPVDLQCLHLYNTRNMISQQLSYIMPQHITKQADSGHSLSADTKPEIPVRKMPFSDLASPSSVVDARLTDECGTSDNEDLRLRDELHEPLRMERLEMLYAKEHMEDVKPVRTSIYVGVESDLGSNRSYQPNQKLCLQDLTNELLGEPDFHTSSVNQAMLAPKRGERMLPVIADEVHLAHPNGLVQMDETASSNSTFGHFNASFHFRNVARLVDDSSGTMIPTFDNHASYSLAGRSPRDAQPVASMMACVNKCGYTGDLLLHLPRVASGPHLFENAEVSLRRYDTNHVRSAFWAVKRLDNIGSTLDGTHLETLAGVAVDGIEGGSGL